MHSEAYRFVFLARLMGCARCREILEHLENVDDEVARGHGVLFLRTPDLEFAETQGVQEFPALVYFDEKVSI